MRAFFKCIFILILFYSNFAYSVFETKAQYALLMDADSGSILYEKNADIAFAPSSMSKIMTAYVAFEFIRSGKVKLSDEFIVSENAWKTEGSRMFLPLGKKVSLDNLLKGLIIQSGNDAAVTIAEGLMGSEEEFASKMNEIGKKIGLKNSQFANSTGLPNDNHFMTCKDLALLAYKTIRDFPDYYSLYSVQEFTYNNIWQPNRNGLLYRNIGSDGLKTGHTNVAGFSLTSSAVKDGRRIIAVVSGLNSDKDRTIESEKLLKYGFMSFTNHYIAKKNEVLEEVKIWQGVNPSVGLISDDPIIITTPVDAPIKIEVKYNTPIAAPVKKNDKIATLIVTTGGNSKEYILNAATSVAKKSFFGKIIDNIKYYLIN